MPLTVGLRFDNRDARLLQALADRGRSEGLHSEHIGLFQRAAKDARVGEPLRVICNDVTEAELMADGFVVYGVRRPAVEALSA